MSHLEYLIGFGLAGDFGRFRAADPLDLVRGGRVVVRSERGVELGWVLRPAGERLGRFLGSAGVGALLRAAGADDEEQALRMQRRAGELLERGGQVLEEKGMPAALLDAEVLLDGEHAVLHVTRWDEADLRELVRPLSTAFELSISLSELGGPVKAAGGCGSCGEGGCGSCGEGGGCGSSCSAGVRPEEVREYFAGLRDKMEQRRVPLL